MPEDNGIIPTTGINSHLTPENKLRYANPLNWEQICSFTAPSRPSAITWETFGLTGFHPVEML
jgi:hypothetical protein